MCAGTNVGSVASDGKLVAKIAQGQQPAGIEGGNRSVGADESDVRLSVACGRELPRTYGRSGTLGYWDLVKTVLSGLFRIRFRSRRRWNR